MPEWTSVGIMPETWEKLEDLLELRRAEEDEKGTRRLKLKRYELLDELVDAELRRARRRAR